MLRRTLLTPVVLGLLAAGSTTLVASLSPSAGAATKVASCAALTKAVVVRDGFTAATTPAITAYNYTTASANSANALGTTIDFGTKALVVGCVSPSDISKLSAAAQGPSKPAMSATKYMAYLVKQSAGSMTKTPIGAVSDYLDFGSGKGE
jgi:hypothetical protein